MKSKKIKFGDIVEIKTSKGYAYAIYTHKHGQMGALIRIFNGLYAYPLQTLDDLVDRQIEFVIFFPLQAAVNRSLVRIAGNIEIPEKEKNFPLFRNGIAHPVTGKVETWWLWDGEKEWKIGTLSADQHRLPLAQVWNDTTLIQRIEEGWKPEKDDRL